MLEDDKVVGWSAVRQLLFIAVVLHLVSASPLNEGAQLLHIDQHPVECRKMLEFDENENGFCPPTTLDEAEFSLEDHRPLVYRDNALPLGSVDRSSVKKENFLRQ